MGKVQDHSGRLSIAYLIKGVSDLLSLGVVGVQAVHHVQGCALDQGTGAGGLWGTDRLASGYQNQRKYLSRTADVETSKKVCNFQSSFASTMLK